MSAPDLETLFKIEPAYEDSAKIFLSSAVGISAFVSGEASDFISPRLELIFNLGEAKEPPSDPVPNLSEGEYSKYGASFSVIVITDPTLGQTRAIYLTYQRPE